MKPLSLVIITYNRPDDALDLARNIQQLNGLEEWVEEVIIVNNRSTVSYQALEDFIAAHPAVPFRYSVAPENLGVSRGRNYAIGLSRARYLVFLDDDAVFRDPEVLRSIVPIFEEKDSEDPGRIVGIAAFKVYYYATGEMQENAFPHKRFTQRRNWPQFDTAYFSGCAHAIRRSVFDAVGVYPENFFYGMEEYDLSYRAVQAGFAIRYDDRVVIRHKESPAGRLTPRDKLRGMWVNKSKVAWKYLPLRFFYTTAFLWSLEYLKKSGWHLGGFFKGWGEVFGIPRIERRRPVGAAARNYLRRVKARLTY
ncbi:glycosyltransferase family 2 protein [Puia sp.]|jgi:GT2 family glycosyltransferase|uniref:glycosyltransferase family 2 protein n=1 Tax=Puia sp. TaxID=2045100 RepID=UPI002F41793A